MAKSEVGTSAHLELNGATTNITSIGTLAWPSGTQAGDIAYIAAMYYQQSGAFVVSTPSGFTLIGAKSSIDNGGGGGTGVDTTVIQLFVKELSGAESGALTIANDIGGYTMYGNVILAVFRGDGALTHTSLNTLNCLDGSTDATAASVSGTAGQLLVSVYAVTDPPGTTNSNPSGMTLAHAGGTVTTTGAIFFQELSSSGATGDKTWDFTNTRDSGAWLALADDAGAGGSIVPQAMLLGVG